MIYLQEPKSKKSSKGMGKKLKSLMGVVMQPLGESLWFMSDRKNDPRQVHQPLLFTVFRFKGELENRFQLGSKCIKPEGQKREQSGF